MAFHFRCSQCGYVDKKPDEITPIRVHCPNCDAVFVVSKNGECVRSAECSWCKKYVATVAEGDGSKYVAHNRPSDVNPSDMEECTGSLKWCLFPTGPLIIKKKV